MAEIHVERKRGVGAWVWLLLLIVLIVAAVLYLWQAGYINLGWNDAAVQQLALMKGGSIYGAA